MNTWFNVSRSRVEISRVGVKAYKGDIVSNRHTCTSPLILLVL